MSFHRKNILEKVIFIWEKVQFSVENRPSFEIENLGTYCSIFHNSKNLASFSLHFWTIQWMLERPITYFINNLFKTKTTVC